MTAFGKGGSLPFESHTLSHVSAIPWRVEVKPHHDNPCLYIWQHFDMPHDIVASEDGNVYIGDAHTNTVWKFTLTESMLLCFFTCLFLQYF